MALQFASKLQVFLHWKSTGNIDTDVGVLVGVGWIFVMLKTVKRYHQDVVFFKAILTFTGNLAIFLLYTLINLKLYFYT